MSTVAPPQHRSFSYLTMQWSIELDYASLTIIMDAVFDVWDHLEKTNGPDDATADKLDALIEHIGELRELTGWGGVPAHLIGGSAR